MLSSEKYKDLSDQELIQRYKGSGELAIVGELYNRYMMLVYGVCLKYLKDREESKDAVMQIFEKLLTSLREHDVANFKAWLYTISRNHCLMQLRAKKGKNFQEISEIFMETGAAMHLEDDADMESNLSKLEHCIEQLVAEQKSCIRLFYIQQKCYKDIVALTGYDDNKVKSYIQNGKRNLKICMDQNG
jgi:RNA polymerase sigma-70 factor (ECF subfamily)